MAESVLISLVLVLVWIACVVILQVIDSNFNKHLASMIKLRSGTQYLFGSQVDQFRTCILFIDEILTGLKMQDSTTKQQTLFDPPSNRVRNLSLKWTMNVENQRVQFMSLKEHIYSFEWEQGGRFLFRKAPYNYSYNLNGAALTVSKNLNLLTQEQEFQYLTGHLSKIRLQEPSLD